MAKHELMTTQEYLETPETLVPTELIYGVLRVADSPMVPHQEAVGEFFLALTAHVRENQLWKLLLSPLDVIFDAPRALILQPDLFFVSNERRHIVSDRVRGVPDLVLEVLSPHPRIGRLAERIGWFAEYGVRECWLRHQLERRLEVLRFAGGGVIGRALFDERTPTESVVLPDFKRSLGSILGWE